MKQRAIGFIGGGRITRIMIEAWAQAATHASRIKVYDKDGSASERLALQFPAWVTHEQSIRELSDCSVIVLAVHPPVMVETLMAIKPYLKSDTLVVSLAPKITLRAMHEALGGHDHLARVNPAATGIVGNGLNPYAVWSKADLQDAETINQLFGPLGTTMAVDESKIEAYAIISAMGPTYFWFQLAQLRDLAIQFGMDQAEADAAIERMMQGAVQTLFHAGLSFDAVMDLVPVKPLAAHESTIKTIYQDNLGALFAKIRP